MGLDLCEERMAMYTALQCAGSTGIALLPRNSLLHSNQSRQFSINNNNSARTAPPWDHSSAQRSLSIQLIRAASCTCTTRRLSTKRYLWTARLRSTRGCRCSVQCACPNAGMTGGVAHASHSSFEFDLERSRSKGPADGVLCLTATQRQSLARFCYCCDVGRAL